MSSWTKGDPDLARVRVESLIAQLPHALTLPALIVVVPLEGAPVVASTELNDQERTRLADWCADHHYPRDLVRIVANEQNRQLQAGVR